MQQQQSRSTATTIITMSSVLFFLGAPPEGGAAAGPGATGGVTGDSGSGVELKVMGSGCSCSNGLGISSSLAGSGTTGGVVITTAESVSTGVSSSSGASTWVSYPELGSGGGVRSAGRGGGVRSADAGSSASGSGTSNSALLSKWFFCHIFLPFLWLMSSERYTTNTKNPRFENQKASAKWNVMPWLRHDAAASG